MFMSWFWRKRSTHSAPRPGRLGAPCMSHKDVVGAALLSPGFAPDCSVWRLTINEDGILHQEMRISNSQNSFSGESRASDVTLPAGALEEILSVAERIGFERFDDKYDDSVLDEATFWIAVRSSNGHKKVE